ncbi:MAG: FadR family transcriptional regulator [Actinomycetales bacterium]|nr:FadR family transcriptional regulator [Actinomycetales bacterium]
MVERASSAKELNRIPSIQTRMPAQRLGVAVVEALVNVIVSGELLPGDTLPPELPLSQQFGVSRTVLRESVKRLEEKGLVSVGQGRGTVVQPTRNWNMMDRVVLTALIAHDDSLGVLDELSIVRARLEAAMAGETARIRSDDQLAALRATLEDMRGSLDDYPTFSAADVQFHETVMAISGNRLAESIARVLFERARESARYHGTTPHAFHEQTLREHEAVFATIEASTADAAEQAMYSHIIDAWQRRRFPDHQGRRRR